jgi:hypothetical protein
VREYKKNLKKRLDLLIFPLSSGNRWRDNPTIFCSGEIILFFPALFFIMLTYPRRYGIPYNDSNAWVRSLDKMGGSRGVLPLGCLPLWGKEGVTLKIFRTYERNLE